MALADSDISALSDTIVQYRNVRPYAALDTMLSEAELDAVVVTLPSAQHAHAARAVLEAGRHLYLEKPLSTTIEDGASVLDAWQRANRVAVVGFNCRANPLHVRLRELIRSGRAGPLVYMHTVFATAPRSMPEWKRLRSTGGGALLDLGAHHIDLIRFLTGREITGARAAMTSRRTEHDTVVLELALDGGVPVHAFFSLASAETDRVEVHGEVARMSVSRFISLDVEVTDNPGRGGGAFGRVLRRTAMLRHLPRVLQVRRAPLREPGFGVLLDRFVHGALTGTQPTDVPGIADGLACAAAIDAAERSFVSGRMETPWVPAGARSLVAATS